jgi:hypothetical protein
MVRVEKSESLIGSNGPATVGRVGRLVWRLALIALDTFNSTWLIGLAAFGVHLVLLVTLVMRSGWATRALEYVLIVAGLAYITDTVAHSLLSNYADYETLFLAIVAVPSIIAEGWFGLWLLFYRKLGSDVDPSPTGV